MNEEFRRWLAAYAEPQHGLQRYESTMAGLRGQLKVGRKLTRETVENPFI